MEKATAASAWGVIVQVLKYPSRFGSDRKGYGLCVQLICSMKTASNLCDNGMIEPRFCFTRITEQEHSPKGILL